MSGQMINLQSQYIGSPSPRLRGWGSRGRPGVAPPTPPRPCPKAHHTAGADRARPVTPWTAAHQAPPSVGFSRQECWSGVPSPSPYDVLMCCYRKHWCLVHLWFRVLNIYYFFCQPVFSFYPMCTVVPELLLIHLHSVHCLFHFINYDTRGENDCVS